MILAIQIGMTGRMRAMTSSIPNLTYADIISRPHGGLTTAVDLTWGRRDTGYDWLVIERGHIVSADGRGLWTASGRIVRASASPRGARAMATRLARRSRARGANGRYDVVPRHAVAVTVSGAPYGCMAGEMSA